LDIKILVYWNHMKRYIVVIFIFIGILFLRFWKVPELFNFTFSEEMQAVMAWEQIKNFHPIWIGVSAANINYYLGPGFTYLNAILFYFSKGDPVILSYFSALLGFVTVISLFYITNNLFSKNIAIFSSIIYGCSTLINLHDRRFWNPTPIPFITLWLIFSLIKAKQNTNWYIATAILIGLIFHTHLSLLFLLIPTSFSILQNIKKIKLTTWATMIFCYLVVTSPLIVFDFVHNFDNLLMPYRTLTGEKKADLYAFSVTDTISHAKELLSALGRIWFIKMNTNPQDEVILESHMNKTSGNIIFSLISLVALGWFFLKNRQKDFQIFFIALLTIISAFIFYPSYNPEYYLMSFITLMTIVIGYWLNSLPKSLSLVLIGLFIFVNVLTTVTLSDKYGLTVRKQLVIQTMTAIKSQDFSLETEGVLPNKQFSYAGWRYLFKTYGRTPSQSNVDQVLSWIYPDEVSQKKIKFKVIVSDTIKLSFKEKPLATFHSGDYYSYVIDN